MIIFLHVSFIVHINLFSVTVDASFTKLYSPMFSFDRAEQALYLHNSNFPFRIHCVTLLSEVSDTPCQMKKNEYTSRSMHNQNISGSDEKNRNTMIIFIYLTPQQYVTWQVFSPVLSAYQFRSFFVNHIYMYSLSGFKWANWQYHTTRYMKNLYLTWIPKCLFQSGDWLETFLCFRFYGQVNTTMAMSSRSVKPRAALNAQ